MVLNNETNFILLQLNLKMELRSLLRDEIWLDEKAIKIRNWNIAFSDDNGIYDDDAAALGKAMQYMGCKQFCAMPVCWATTDGIVNKFDYPIENKAFLFDASEDGIEEFQKARWYDINLGACIFFDEKLSFLVLRTGDVVHTLYAGTQEFIDIATSASSLWVLSS